MRPAPRQKACRSASCSPIRDPIAIISFMSAITGTRHPDLVHRMDERASSPTEYQAMAANAPYFFGPTVDRRHGSGSGAAATRRRRRGSAASCSPSTGRRSRRCAAPSSSNSTACSRARDGASGVDRRPAHAPGYRAAARVLDACRGAPASSAGAGARHCRPAGGARLFVTGLRRRPVRGAGGVGDGAAPSASTGGPSAPWSSCFRRRTLHEADRVDRDLDVGQRRPHGGSGDAVQCRGVPLLALVNGDGGKPGKMAGTKVSLDLPTSRVPVRNGELHLHPRRSDELAAVSPAGAAPGRIPPAIAAQRAAIAGCRPAAGDDPAAPSTTASGFLSAGADSGTAPTAPRSSSS